MLIRIQYDLIIKIKFSVERKSGLKMGYNIRKKAGKKVITRYLKV